MKGLGIFSLEKKKNQKGIREFFQCLKRLSNAQVSRPVLCCSKYQTRTMHRTSKETDFYTIRDMSFEPMKLFNCGANCSPSKTENSIALGGRGWGTVKHVLITFGFCIFSLRFLCFSWLTNAIHSVPHVSKEKLL